MLWRNKSFSVAALLALAMGIGVNSALFSVVNAVLLRPLPYRDAGRMAVVWSPNSELRLSFGESIPPSNGDFMDWRARNRVFSSLAAFSARPVNLSGTGQPEMATAVGVTTGFFEALQVPPLQGRTFSAEDEKPGKSRVAVISASLWRNRLASDPQIIGKSLLLDGEEHTVIGVMPERFQFPRASEMPSGYGLAPRTDLWVPMGWTEKESQSRGIHEVIVIGRLKPEITFPTAQTEMNAISRQIQVEHPVDSKNWGAKVQPMREEITGGLRPALAALMGAVGFVLLIACANVANLLLARATARTKEIGLRVALGAGRGRLVRQLLTESLLLSVVGSLLGLALATAMIQVVLSLAPASIPRIQETHLDLTVLAFTLTLGLLTGILFGLAPALQVSRTDIHQALKQGGGKGLVGGSGKRLRDVLVVAEVAFVLVLLVGAGLLLRSFAQVEAIRPGFQTHSLLAMDISLPGKKYGETSQRSAFFDRALERVKLLPGVDAAGIVSILPMSGMENMNDLTVEGRPKASGQVLPVDDRSASVEYFRAMAIPLERGRFFRDSDHNVAIVNESLAKTYFPQTDAIGKRIKDGGGTWLTIVGIAGDIRSSSLETEARPQVYRLFREDARSQMTLVLKSAQDPRGLAQAVRREIAALDPDQAVSKVRTIEQVLSDTVEARRFSTISLSIFAGLALVLTIVGLYGVISYSASQRTAEIAIRVALGASHGNVLRLVVGEGLRLTLAGAAIGLVGSITLARSLRSMLYGVGPFDLVTLACVLTILTAVSAIACYVPARRASKTDPLTALRGD